MYFVEDENKEMKWVPDMLEREIFGRSVMIRVIMLEHLEHHGVSDKIVSNTGLGVQIK